MPLYPIFFILLLSSVLYIFMGAPNNSWMISCITISIISLLLFLSRLKIFPRYFTFNIKILGYILWLLKEILISSVNIAYLGWKKDLKLSSTIKVIYTNQNTQLGEVVFANSITLTPGTVTIAQKDQTLTVQAINQNLLDDLEKGKMKFLINSMIVPNINV